MDMPLQWNFYGSKKQLQNCSGKYLVFLSLSRFFSSSWSSKTLLYFSISCPMIWPLHFDLQWWRCHQAVLTLVDIDYQQGDIIFGRIRAGTCFIFVWYVVLLYSWKVSIRCEVSLYILAAWALGLAVASFCLDSPFHWTLWLLQLYLNLTDDVSASWTHFFDQPAPPQCYQGAAGARERNWLLNGELTGRGSDLLPPLNKRLLPWKNWLCFIDVCWQSGTQVHRLALECVRVCWCVLAIFTFWLHGFLPLLSR